MDIFIELPAKKGRLTLRKQERNMKLKTLKDYLELKAGIPFHVQRLQYLDMDDISDDADLRQCSVVKHATINLKVWEHWDSLVDAVFRKKPERVISIVNDSQEMFSVALYVAASWDIEEVLDALMSLQMDVNGQTKSGRTALHAAAVKGNCKLIGKLIEMGANIDIKDLHGNKPLNIAQEFKNRDVERLLFLLHWRQRTDTQPCWKDKSGLMMHQLFDSGYPTWIKGEYAQMYMSTTFPRVKAKKMEKDSRSSLLPKPIRHESLSLPDLAAEQNDKAMAVNVGHPVRKEKLTTKFMAKKDITKSKVRKSVSPTPAEPMSILSRESSCSSIRYSNGNLHRGFSKSDCSLIKQQHLKFPHPSNPSQKEEVTKKKIVLYEDWNHVPCFRKLILANENPQDLLFNS